LAVYTLVLLQYGLVKRGILSARRGDGDARGSISHAARALKVIRKFAIIAPTRLGGPHGRWVRDRRLIPHMPPPRGLPTLLSPSCGGGEEEGEACSQARRSYCPQEPRYLLLALQEAASSPVVNIPGISRSIMLILLYLPVCIRQCCLRFVDDNGCVLCDMQHRVGHREGDSPKDASLPRCVGRCIF
jgi:hypothetical protein